MYTNLTTGRYDEALPIGQELAGSAVAPSHLLVAVRVCMYAAAALKPDRRRARRELDSLQDALTALPRDFATEWSYNGTLNYIRTSGAPEPRRSRVVARVQAISKDPSHVSRELFADDRAVVGGLIALGGSDTTMAGVALLVLALAAGFSYAAWRAPAPRTNRAALKCPPGCQGVLLFARIRFVGRPDLRSS